MRIWRLAILAVDESRISRGRGAADDLPGHGPQPATISMNGGRQEGARRDGSPSLFPVPGAAGDAPAAVTSALRM